MYTVRHISTGFAKKGVRWDAPSAPNGAPE